jgi:phospholipid transport system substrate-binding protein
MTVLRAWQLRMIDIPAGLRRLLALLLVLAAPAVAGEALGPEQLVRTITEQVLAAIKQDPALKAGDRAKALALAEEKILPHVDFVEATRLAAGRVWATATPAQRDRLVAEFRAMMVRTYATAIDAYRGQTMQVLPVQMAPGATQTTVRNRYIRPGAQPVIVTYSMHQTPTGWKIYDITVEGVSLVLNYRTEFEQIVRESGIDGLIKRLADKNKTPVK